MRPNSFLETSYYDLLVELWMEGYSFKSVYLVVGVGVE